MKKLYALTILSCLTVYTYGQFKEGRREFNPSQLNATDKTQLKQSQKLAPGDVYYSQDFENFTPGDMIFIDNDRLTPHSSVASIGSNWNVIEGAALTTSYLTNGNKTSDNWMITPAISLGTQPYLTWMARSFDATYPDGYRVLISTTGQSISDFSTVLFEIGAEEIEYTSHLVDLSAYEGQTVYIAFHHNSTDMLVLAVDDILVSHLDGLEVGLNSVIYQKYIKATVKTPVTCVIENNNIDTLRSIGLNYQLNGGAVHSDIISDIEVSFGQKIELTHSDSILNLPDGKYDLKVWLSDFNGAGGIDGDSSNDTISSLSCYSVNTNYQKTVLLEKYTGTWCQFCPNGIATLENLHGKFDNLIGVAAHYGDVMQTAQTLEAAQAIATGYPSASIDRYKFTGEDIGLGASKWESAVLKRLDMAVPVQTDFTVTFDETTREIVVDASAEFSLGMTEDFRFNCYIIEEKVFKNHSDYYQTNYYNGVTGHAFFGRGNPITDLVHKHVIREMLGGVWGEAGSIPATVSTGQVYTHQFTHTLSKEFNPNQIYIVVVVQEYNNDINKRTVQNAKRKKLSAKSIELIKKDGEFIFDNDTLYVEGKSTDAIIEFDLKVQNIAPTTKSFNVTKEILENVDGTMNTFCWAGNCFGNDINTSTSPSVMGPDSINTEFLVELVPGGNVGTQKMRYTFENADDVKDNIHVNVFFEIVEGSSNINDVNSKNNIKYGPNPIEKNGILRIDFSKQITGKSIIKMYDNTSRLVLTRHVQNLNGGSIEVGLGQYNLSAGTYFLIITSEKENIAVPVIILE